MQDENGVWYSIRIMPYRTLENVIDGVVINFVDVSNLKDIKQLNRLATVVRDSNDAVTVQDFDGNILAWNKGATQLYGWSEAEALKMNIREIVPQNKRKELAAITKKIKNAERPEPFVTQRLCKNRKVLDVWLTFTGLKDESGRLVEIATTERDITELKKIRVQAIR
jgi:two-component system CheB/CheR fusion protein